MSRTLFSVIIPTYNRSAQLARCVKSILKQREGNFELIIVDDGSTDDTAEVMKAFLPDGRVKYIFQENRERGAARNRGGQMAIGEFLNFFDSDDYMYENHLQAANEFLKTRSNVNFFHTCYRVVDEKGVTLVEESGVEHGDPANRLIETNYLSCNSVFIKRATFLENQFNDDIRLSSAEDWELWLRIISRENLFRCSEITFEILNHPGRSLFSISPERIEERDKLLMLSLLRDPFFLKKFLNQVSLFQADLYTFSGLAFSISKNGKLKAVQFLTKSVLASFNVLWRGRFWATVKHILTKPF